MLRSDAQPRPAEDADAQADALTATVAPSDGGGGPAATPREIAQVGVAATLSVGPMRKGGEEEALAFLSRRPAHTFVLAGFVRDNGLESARNRGAFYSCRDAAGRLAGVALLGHATLFEAESDDAYRAFGDFARALPPPHIIGGDSECVDLFWSAYARPAEPPHTTEDWLHYELRYPVAVPPPAPELRAAGLEHADEIARIHAQMAFESSGVNPLEVDREGFMLRTAQRIERGRVWVCADGARINFKADVVSESDEVIYLEGVHVAPSERGKGVGRRCLAQLCRQLLARTRAVIVLVDSRNAPAVALYRSVGFRLLCRHKVIFPHAGARA